MTDTVAARVHVRVQDDGVAWLTLDNPSKLNAMSLPMWRGLSDALTRFESDSSVRCVVLTGQGEKAFCVGADMSQFEEIRSGPEASAEYDAVTRGTLDQLASFSTPTIAMISGFCLGAGVALAAACDLRMAAVGARVSIPAAKLGIGYHFSAV
jgi:enoyl-CoA hydratase